jgi:hypothetical protein
MKVATEHHEGFPTSLLIRKISIQTPGRLHCIPTGWLWIKGEKTNIGKNVEKWQPSCTGDGNGK